MTGAVYCWVPQLHDCDQTDVLEQERRGRQQAESLGFDVTTRNVFVDHQLSAWEDGATPHAWGQMLAAARARRFRHLFLYRAEKLQPRALADLLRTARDCGLILHGHPLDLNDPLVREEELARISALARARARSADLAQSIHDDAAAAGRPHGGGLRPYGYLPGMAGLVPEEAAVVREIFTRFLAGESLRSLAVDFNRRGVPTSTGASWRLTGVARILDAPRYAGLRVSRGEIIRTNTGDPLPAAWPPCVSLDIWEQAQERRRDQTRIRAARHKPQRFYPLTSLVWCTRCERPMVGSMVGAYPTYACSSTDAHSLERCSRHVGAQPLEVLVSEAAVRLLEALPANGQPSAPAVSVVWRPSPQAAARSAHRGMRARPANALDGVIVGPGARRGWRLLSPHRKATAIRYLFAAIRISASSGSRSVFDPGRVLLIPRPPHGCA